MLAEMVFVLFSTAGAGVTTGVGAGVTTTGTADGRFALGFVFAEVFLLSTDTLQVTFLLFTFAVILAVPTDFAFTTPF